MIAVIWQEGEEMCLLAPYQVNFIQELKEEIPKKGRRWDPEDRVWYIRGKHKERLLRLIDIYYDWQWMHKTYAVQAFNNYRMLLSGLTPDGLKRVWRVVAKELHPDVGGDHDKFIAAHTAFQRLTGVST